MRPKIIRGVGLGELRDNKAPGVYEPQEFGMPQREFFATGIPAFLGTVETAIPAVAQEKTPTPHMLSLWTQFDRHIGAGYLRCMLGYAVRGFFENGGHWCYVVVLKDRSDAQLAAGLEAIADLNTVDLVCVPDLSANSAEALTQQQMVVDHCEDMGNRFAILDSHHGDAPGQIAARWSEIDGHNGALYYPWVRVKGFGTEWETVPPCGHIAGVIDRVDRDRGVHKAPANEALNGIIDLERAVTDHDQKMLNPTGVNCLRSFPGRGIRIWGARTLNRQQAWTSLNVRRVFVTAAHWLDRHLIDTDFEPNEARLWAHIQRSLTEYFTGLYRSGALQGATLTEAFYVKCNAETNPPELRDSGQVITEIGLATAVPFEFVVVRLIRGMRDATLSGTSGARRPARSARWALELAPGPADKT